MIEMLATHQGFVWMLFGFIWVKQGLKTLHVLLINLNEKLSGEDE